MIKIDVRGVPEVKASLQRLRAELRDKAQAMAINKVTAKAQTELTRAITSEFAIDRQSVKNSVYVRRATARPNAVEAVIQIFGSARKRGRSLNVVHFLEKSITLAEAKRRAKRNMLYGIVCGGRLLPVLGFKFKKSGGVKHVEGAFLGNKGRTVFVRVGDSRLPIMPVQMIGVSQMFTTERVRSRVMARISAELPVEMQRAVEQVLRTAR